MAWLDFLKNGNELSELLIEGNNPYGARLLSQGDVDQLRDHVQPGERVLGYVLGRVLNAGRGLWVLTDQHLLISEDDQRSAVLRLALKDIAQAECVKGKYGYTLRVRSGGQQRSVYGAAGHLAAVFYQALGQKVSCSPVFKPASLDVDDVAEVVHRFCDAALRLQPGISVEADVQILVARLAEEVANHAGQPPARAAATH